MPRRRQDDSLIVDFAQEFASLPWWAGVTTSAVLVALGFLLPHLVGANPMALIGVIFGQWFLWITAAMTLLFTGRGIVRRAFDARRFDRTEDVGNLDAYQYENYVAEYYRRRGYAVTQRGGAGPDGGVDLVIAKDGERLLVQCKHWRAWRIGPQPVRELWGLVDHERAAGAVFVTSKDFTSEARAFAIGKRLDLIDGRKLAAMVAAVKAEAGVIEATQPAVATTAAARICPECGAPMVVRTAQRGARTGERFLGCSTYPKCRGTRPLAADDGLSV